MFLKLIFALLLLIVATQSDYLRSHRIINGELADIKQFPFQVSLHFNFSKKYLFFCGGSVISANSVLTAAHCISDKKPGKYLVRTGSSYQNQYGTVYEVSNVISHPGYDLRDVKNDIGIVRTNQPLFNTPNVRLVHIWKKDDPERGQPVTCIGWGRTGPNSNSSISLKLLSVNLKIIDRMSCRHNISKVTRHRVSITKNHICAGDLSQGPYQGDSGGPLLYNGQLYGIVSFGARSSSFPPIPTVYTRVKSYLKWINKTLKINSANYFALSFYFFINTKQKIR